MRLLLKLLLIGVLIWFGFMVAGSYQVRERLLDTFLAYNAQLPGWMSFEQFLVAVIVACLLVVIGLLAIGLVGFVALRRAVSVARHHQAAQETALHHALDRLKAQVQQEYERLITLSTTLTQRLDKRAILQNVLQAATQMTSLPHADSAVGMWVLDFDTDRMHFETGIRCDQTLFAKTAFELNEQPLTRLVAANDVLRFEKWQDGFPFLVPDKAAKLGSASAILIIPLVIERTVLGFLVVFCHPDVLKTYEDDQKFFNAAWGQLTLALAIAIQGELAIRDRLTGLVNQAYFLKRLSQEVDRCSRYQLTVGLLMIDIDDFKAVNDTLGHPQGDAVLKIVSKLIRKEVRAIDLVGRYGGEEFIVLLLETGFSDDPDATGSSSALIVAERIRKGVEEEFHELKKPLSVTISVGVAVRRFPEDRQMDAHDLIRVADEELYKAKAAGKNRCCVYLPEEIKSP